MRHVRQKGLITTFVLLVTVLLVIGLAALYFWGRHAFGAPDESGLRRHLQEDGALTLMANGARLAANGISDPFSAAENARLNNEGVMWWRTLPAYEKNVEGLQFEFGGADRHYGVLVLTKGDAPPDDSYEHVSWGDGIWFYSEIPLHY
jgi:hypothetical protein